MPSSKRLKCACSRAIFRVRVDAAEQVALLTCDAEHSSFLLDSADYWGDVLQNGRPKEKKCRCGEKRFVVTLDYAFREAGTSVQAVEVGLACAACRARRTPVTFEIDYEPTDSLVDAPLVPCAHPWLKAKHVEITALWKEADLEELVAYAAGLDASIVLAAGWRERPVVLERRRLFDQVDFDRPYDVFMTNASVELPEKLRDAWRRAPVVHVGSPIHMRYRTGEGDLYYVHYAEERLEGPSVVAQPVSFVAYARGLVHWLRERFVSERGKNTADNPEEWQRLRGF
jgi:hypothetical protein